MFPPRDLVFGFFESEKPFPIDFDDAWCWVGYGEKSGNEKNARDAARKFLKANFEEGVDFAILKTQSTGGRPRDSIYLSVDCFKMFSMMAGTLKGRQVRLYFLNCEKELKRRVAEEKQRHKGKVLEAYVNKDKLPWKKKFEDDFYQHIYRLKGWEYPANASGRTPLLGKITNDIVYMRLQPGVLQALQSKNPILTNGRRRYRHHQFLTVNIGNPHLRFHLSKLIMFMSRCNTWNGFMTILDRFMPSPYNIQPDIFFELLEAGHIDFDEWEKLVS